MMLRDTIRLKLKRLLRVRRVDVTTRLFVRPSVRPFAQHPAARPKQ